MVIVFERIKRKYFNRHSKDKCARIEYPESPNNTDTQVRRGGKFYQLKEVNQSKLITFQNLEQCNGSYKKYRLG